MFKLSFPAGALVLGLAVPGPAGAAGDIELSIGELAGAGWRVASPRAVLDLSGEVPRLRVSAPAVLAEGGRELVRDLRLTCRDVTVNPRYLACPSGNASAVVPPAREPVRTSLAFVLRRQDGRWRASGEAGLGEGVRWSAAGEDEGLRGSIRADSLPVAALQPWLPRLPGSMASLSGRLTSLKAEVRLPRDGPARAEASLHGTGLGFDTDAGLMAAAGLSGRLALTWEGRAGDWRSTVDASVEGGEFLAGSFYTKLEGGPVEGHAAVSAESGEWRVESFEVNDPDAFALRGDAVWQSVGETGLRRLEATLEEARFPRFYGDYLQPVLAQYGFGNLATAGSVAASVSVEEGDLASLSVALNHLDVSDTRGRLEFVDLNGGVRWRESGEPVASSLTWQDARVYSIPLGSADVRAESVADDFRLTRQTLLPALDGALVINALEVADWFGDEPRLLLDARLMPISLTALSEVLDWPRLEGTLAGRIPELTFRDGVYRLGGSLVVDVFDGSVLVENLRLERPFGVLPKLVADVRLNDLDLEKLTGIFTIGRITGRLAGHVNSLRLLDWEAVHFDARLATPADDESEHAISQRAVDTLANLGGGGAGGALSRTFLRVFDEFGYQQLGITCRLQNNVCRMGGVAPAPRGGYYIVEGGGLPRVDVIGYVRRVDWPVLVDQLIQAMQGQGPSLGPPSPSEGGGE